MVRGCLRRLATLDRRVEAGPQIVWLLRALGLAVLASALIGEMGARREQLDPTHPHLYAIQIATIAVAALVAITLFTLSLHPLPDQLG